MSVVIPVATDISLLRGLLQDLERQTRLPDEVVVVRTQGGDVPGSSLTLRVVDRPGALPGAARNAGVQAARNAVVAFVDCGLRLDCHWVEALTEGLNRGCDIAWGTVSPKPGNALAAALVLLTWTQSQQPRYIPSMAIRRQVFDQTGGFREDLRAAEDLLFKRAIDRLEAKQTHVRAIAYYGSFPSTIPAILRKWMVYARAETMAGIAWRKGLLTVGLIAALLAASYVLSPVWGVGAYVARSFLVLLRRSVPGRAQPAVILLLPFVALATDTGRALGLLWGVLELVAGRLWGKAHSHGLSDRKR